MREFLYWLIGVLCLMVAGAGIDHHKDNTVLVLAWALTFFIWIVAGALFAARATLRFLRR